MSYHHSTIYLSCQVLFLLNILQHDAKDEYMSLNGISTLPTKEERILAKLKLAQDKKAQKNNPIPQDDESYTKKYTGVFNRD
jgi:hypothetical protein